MDWSEVGIVLPWLAMIHLVYAFAGGKNPSPVNVFGLVGVVLDLLGSFFNTVSEYQRKRWKARNPGKLYTRGLFRISRHVNYFGDSVLFTGFALLTGTLWSLVIPALMTTMFLFQHAPSLEKYLESKYGNDFREWSSKTAMFVPFLY
jgi:steroid 5-alpha reductase family enzyme